MTILASNMLGANPFCLAVAGLALLAAVLLLARRLRMNRRGQSGNQTGPNLVASAVETMPVLPQPPAPPRRKLFLSWAAVHLAVRSGSVTEEELDQCLFCTSVGELNLAEEFDPGWFDRLHPALAKAAKSGRLICNQDREHYNATATWEVNLLLQRNGVAPLTSVDQMGTLEQIPMYSCVPSVSDGSMEVLWATHPLRGDWRRAWGRSLEEIDLAFAELADEPERPSANWMDELNRPIIDEARRKFEKPPGDNAYCNLEGDMPDRYGKADGAEDDDPADFWKKGRPQDEE